MDGIERLAAFARSRGLRLLRRVSIDANVPEPLAAVVKLTIDDERLEIWASPSYFAVEAKVATQLAFSVGAPNKVLYIDGPTATASIAERAVYVPTGRSTDDIEQWLHVPSHRALVTGLLTEPADALHVFHNGISYVGPVRDLDDALLMRVLALRRAIPAPHAPPPLDVSMLPPELGAFAQRFEKLAEGDDERRQELRQRLSRSERAQLLRAVRPLFPELNQYLASLTGPWPDAAITLSQLGELASEIMVVKGDAVSDAPQAERP